MIAKFLILACSFFLSIKGFGNDPLTPKEIELNTQPEKKLQRKSPTVKAAFSPFTGKISGDKVRMRLQPDLDGHIICELNKNELISVIDQEGEYYCVKPPAIKAYVFRSFVLDGIVEGNRVNVRLEPDLESPIVGHLNSGDRINGQISSHNRKWLEIDPPSSARFYVAKEFIEYAGGPELKEKMAERKESAEQLLEAANLFAKAEMEKTFEEIDFERIKQGFLTVIHDYTDFPQKAEAAKEALASAQEVYLQKRISYLEEKASLAPSSHQFQKTTLSQSFQTWNTIEEAIYASWANSHEQKSVDSFYEEQKQSATSISGILEVFTSPVRNKPGDFILKNKNLPIAYVYSTKIDLQDYVGKQVTLIGSDRDNHNFAFPAYFIHEVE